MPIRNTFYVLETVTGASDAVLNNHILTITGLQPMDFRRIESYGRRAPVAPANGTLTITPSGSTGTQNILISQFVKSIGKETSIILTSPNYTSAPAAATVVADWKRQLDLTSVTNTSTTVGKSGFNMSYTDATGTLVLTPNSPDSVINFRSIGSAAVTSATNTQTLRVGFGADLLLDGFTGVTNTNYYIRFEFVYLDVDTKETTGANHPQMNRQTLLVNNGASATIAGNALALNDRIVSVLQGLDGQVSPVTIEGIAII